MTLFDENHISDLGFTSKQVATRLNKSVKTLARWRRQGKGPPSISGDEKRVYYPVHEYQAWVSGQFGKL